MRLVHSNAILFNKSFSFRVRCPRRTGNALVPLAARASRFPDSPTKSLSLSLHHQSAKAWRVISILNSVLNIPKLFDTTAVDSRSFLPCSSLISGTITSIRVSKTPLLNFILLRFLNHCRNDFSETSTRNAAFALFHSSSAIA